MNKKWGKPPEIPICWNIPSSETVCKPTSRAPRRNAGQKLNDLIPNKMKSAFQKTLTSALMVLASLPAAAQTPPGDPLPKGQETLTPAITLPRTTERSSQLAPANKAHGDTTNRGRMSADFLWGITNGNRTYSNTPAARVPNFSERSPLILDGYTAPYPIENIGTVGAPIFRRQRTDGQGPVSDILNPRIVFDDEASLISVAEVAHPVNGTGPGALGILGGFFRGAKLGPESKGGFVPAFKVTLFPSKVAAVTGGQPNTTVVETIRLRPMMVGLGWFHPIGRAVSVFGCVAMMRRTA